MIPPNNILRKCNQVLRFTKTQEKVTRLRYIEDLKIWMPKCDVTEKFYIKYHIQILFLDIRMDFGIGKILLITKWKS